MKCVACQLDVHWPSEVRSGRVTGICSGCGHPYGVKAPEKPDTRGAPSRPGGK